jgi:hypothetical protein
MDDGTNGWIENFMKNNQGSPSPLRQLHQFLLFLLLVALLRRFSTRQKEAAGYIHPLWMEGWTEGLTG